MQISGTPAWPTHTTPPAGWRAAEQCSVGHAPLLHAQNMTQPLQPISTRHLLHAKVAAALAQLNQAMTTMQQPHGPPHGFYSSCQFEYQPGSACCPSYIVPKLTLAHVLPQHFSTATPRLPCNRRHPVRACVLTALTSHHSSRATSQMSCIPLLPCDTQWLQHPRAAT